METVVNYTVTVKDVEDYKLNRVKMGDHKSVCDYCAFQQAIQRELPGARVEMAYSPIINGKNYPTLPEVASLVAQIDRYADGEMGLPENLPYNGTLTIKT